MADRGETGLEAWETVFALPLLEGRYCLLPLFTPPPYIPLPTPLTALCLPVQGCVATVVDEGFYHLGFFLFQVKNSLLILIWYIMNIF